MSLRAQARSDATDSGAAGWLAPRPSRSHRWHARRHSAAVAAAAGDAAHAGRARLAGCRGPRSSDSEVGTASVWMLTCKSAMHNRVYEILSGGRVLDVAKNLR